MNENETIVHGIIQKAKNLLHNTIIKPQSSSQNSASIIDHGRWYPKLHFVRVDENDSDFFTAHYILSVLIVIALIVMQNLSATIPTSNVANFIHLHRWPDFMAQL